MKTSEHLGTDFVLEIQGDIVSKYTNLALWIELL